MSKAKILLTTFFASPQKMVTFVNSSQVKKYCIYGFFSSRFIIRKYDNVMVCFRK